MKEKHKEREKQVQQREWKREGGRCEELHERGETELRTHKNRKEEKHTVLQETDGF